MSVAHTADTTRSDIDLAGLMLRCAQAGAEVLIVVVSPFPPRATPSITIRSNGNEWRFSARIVSPGAELLLPAEAIDLAVGPWKSAHELAVDVASPERSFGGVIPIDGIDVALTTLAANCPPG